MFLPPVAADLQMRPDYYLDGIDAYSPTYPIPHQILQWTFASSPRHPMLAVVLQRIAYYVSQMTQMQLEDYSRSTRFTLELTGPILFSQVCNEFLSGTREGIIEVLPRIVWGALPQEQINPQLAGLVKVRHMFAGSWKTPQLCRLSANA